MASRLLIQHGIEVGHLRIRVLVADNHEEVREGLRIAFEHTEIDVVAETVDPVAAVRLAREESVDVVLLDIGWPDHAGQQPVGWRILRQIVDVQPEMAILVYSMHGRESYKIRAQGLGARGYVVKGVPNNVLVEAVRRASQDGETWREYG